MVRQSVRGSKGCAGRGVVALLVLGLVNVSVPAFAGESAAPAEPSTPVASAARPVMSLADQATREIQRAFEGSAAQRAQAAQGNTSAGETSGHWCLAGLALTGGGIAAAVISGVQRTTNAQKPSPPVGVALGTAAAVVGGILMIRQCRL